MAHGGGAGGLQRAACNLNQAQAAGARGGGQARVGAQGGDLRAGVHRGCEGRCKGVAAAGGGEVRTWMPSCVAAVRMLVPSGTDTVWPLM